MSSIDHHLAIPIALAALATLSSCKRKGSETVLCKTADEAVSQEGNFKGKRLLVLGRVRAGTLFRREAPCELRFEIERAGARLGVRSMQCAVPETLRDNVEVAIDGSLGPGPVLAAQSIRVRVPPLPFSETTKDWSCGAPLD